MQLADSDRTTVYVCSLYRGTFNIGGRYWTLRRVGRRTKSASTMALSKQQQLDKILEGHTRASEAAKIAGCTSGWVRTLIQHQQIRYLTASGYLFVDDRDIPQLAVRLTSRSKGKKGTAKRPASSR